MIATGWADVVAGRPPIERSASDRELSDRTMTSQPSGVKLFALPPVEHDGEDECSSTDSGTVVTQREMEVCVSCRRELSQEQRRMSVPVERLAKPRQSGRGRGAAAARATAATGAGYARSKSDAPPRAAGSSPLKSMTRSASMTACADVALRNAGEVRRATHAVVEYKNEPRSKSSMYVHGGNPKWGWK